MTEQPKETRQVKRAKQRELNKLLGIYDDNVRRIKKRRAIKQKKEAKA